MAAQFGPLTSLSLCTAALVSLDICILLVVQEAWHVVSWPCNEWFDMARCPNEFSDHSTVIYYICLYMYVYMHMHDCMYVYMYV